MAFLSKTWKARQGVGLNKFSINGDTPVTLVNIPDHVDVAGDAFSEENMNDLERRIALACAETYGVKIDKANSNPDTAVEYTDDAVGLTPSSGNNGSFVTGSWEDKFPYNKIRPCLVKNGVVVGYLNPNNHAQFEDGTAADITSGNAGDVMVEIPKFYYKISQSVSHTFVEISSAPLDGFSDKAFRYKGELKDKFYVGAFSGYVDASDKLRSLSGKRPTVSKTLGTFRTAAQANGVGYEQLNFYKLTALQILYLMRYKSLNSQSALGQGYSNGGSAAITGTTNASGMNYGTDSNIGHVKCNGIEDLWGNVAQFVDGHTVTSTTTIKTADGNFNDAADGYTEHDFTTTSLYQFGFIKDVIGSNELAFTPQNFSGSASTYYADFSRLSIGGGGLGGNPAFGGGYTQGSNCGIFCFDGGISPLSAGHTIGARLILCG